MRMKTNREQPPMHTYCMCQGVEIDNVAVFLDYQPAEPDVNVGESVTIDCVIHDNKYITDKMTQAEFEELENRCADEYFRLSSQEYQDYEEARGDWLYDRAKDDRATGDD